MNPTRILIRGGTIIDAGGDGADGLGETARVRLETLRRTEDGFEIAERDLELRGVPAGTYLLIHRANPEETLEELDYTNNAASIRLRLTWSGSSPRVRTLRVCQDSPRC